MTAHPGDPLIVGVGNRSRGDDAIGPRVVDGLGTRQPALRTMVCEGDLADLALRWESADDVVVIDACGTGQPVGSIHWLEPEQLRSQPPCSTHGIGIAEAVELARLLNRLPRSLQVVGIEARTFDYGPMSAELENAIPSIVDELLTEVLGVRSPASDRRS